MSFGVNRVDRMSSALATISDQYYDSMVYYLPSRRSLQQNIKRHKTLLIIMMIMILTSLICLFAKLGGLHVKRPRYHYQPDPGPKVKRMRTIRPYNDPGGKGGRIRMGEAEPVALGQVVKRFTITGDVKGKSSTILGLPKATKIQKLSKRPVANIKRILMASMTDADIQGDLNYRRDNWARSLPYSLPSGQEDQMVRRIKMAHDFHMKLYKRKGVMVPNPEGGQMLVSGPGRPNLVVLPKIKDLLVEVDPGQDLSDLPHNYNGEFNTWTPEYARIWFNITYKPWINDEECKDLDTVLSRRRLPVVALASFPSSGNTWFRYLLEGATGIFTGSFYSDTTLSMKGHYGEMFPADSGRTTVIKTHGSFLPSVANDTRNHMAICEGRGVVLIRNPYHAIYGHMNLDAGGHLGHASLDKFTGHSWEKYVEVRINVWEKFYTDWIRNGSRVHMVKFEDLSSESMAKTVKQVVEFLDLPEADPKRLECIRSHLEGGFHRKNKCQSGQSHLHDIYSDDQKNTIDSAIERVQKVINDQLEDNFIDIRGYKNTIVDYCH